VALTEHGKAAGREWAAAIDTVPDGPGTGPGKPRWVVRMDMPLEEAQALARLISAASRCPAGDPGQVKPAPPATLSVAQAARYTGYSKGTIRAWVCRGGGRPKRNPFPLPVAGSSDPIRFDQLEVEAWLDRQKARRQRPSDAQDQANPPRAPAR
jgi:predicted DNA-binding transcriptional regulator AlpA